MTTIYLSLNAQVAKITVFMKSPVQYSTVHEKDNIMYYKEILKRTVTKIITNYNLINKVYFPF